MDEDYQDNALGELKRLVEAAGLVGMDNHAPECDTYIFRDANGDYHECWNGASGHVNVVFALTPEQAVAATLGPAIVHCRDCMYAHESNGQLVCWYRTLSKHVTTDDAFCSDGVRRNNEQR